MIRIDKNAVPYLSGLTVCGAITSFSALKAVNEFCGFYQDELTKKNKKDHISYARLIYGFTWLAFSAFSAFGCYLLIDKFKETKTHSLNEDFISGHQEHLNYFYDYYLDRYKEKNSLRNLCWNYLESEEALKAIQYGQQTSSSVNSISMYAFKAFGAVERETDELKRQLQNLKNKFNDDSQSLRLQLQNYEMVQGIEVDFSQICATPYGWLNTQHCETQKKLDHQLNRYSLMDEEIDEYKNEAFSAKNLGHCREAYGINSRFDTVYNLGQSKAESDSMGWGDWIMSFFRSF